MAEPLREKVREHNSKITGGAAAAVSHSSLSPKRSGTPLEVIEEEEAPLLADP